MPRIIRSPRSKADVLLAAGYIAEKSADAATAERWMDAIDEQLNILAQNPMAGESRPDLGQSTRAFPIGNYVIFYRPIDDGIEVSRVLHSARDIPRIFRSGEN